MSPATRSSLLAARPRQVACLRLALALPGLLGLLACANTLDLPGEDAGGGALPHNREGPPDGGTLDAGGPGGPNGPDGGAPAPGDDGGTPGPTCQLWSDCGPFYDDPNSGYACVDEACVCDPDGNAQQNCTAAGGTFQAALCYCQLPPEGPVVGGACQVWQDCAPHYDDPNSGFECVSQTCTCDPSGTYVGRCQSYGGYWVAEECFCAFAGQAPPDEDPNEGCYWHWEAPPCDPDRWVDTSHYEEECYYDANDERVCQSVWVESGYWEPGACPPGYWEQRC